MALSSVAVTVRRLVPRESSELPRLPDADGVAHGLIVHRGESDALLGVFIEKEVLKGGAVQHEPQAIFELAVDLDLDAAVYAVANVGGDLEAAVGEALGLEAVAGNGFLCAFVEQDESGDVFEVVDRCVLGRVGAVVAGASGD